MIRVGRGVKRHDHGQHEILNPGGLIAAGAAGPHLQTQYEPCQWRPRRIVLKAVLNGGVFDLFYS